MQYDEIQVPLKDLKLSPDNVRKTPSSPEVQAQFAASILAKGLIYPLLVKPTPRNGAKFHVVAGGRRLAAYQELAKQGRVPKDHPVRCGQVPKDADAAEISLIENTIREAMHPADQFVAFKRLADEGMSFDTIAERFGVSECTVERRLKLAAVAPELIDLYRAGDMTLGTLEAFTLSDDPDQQRKVWDAVSRRSYRGNLPGLVRNALTETRMAASRRIARYAGIEKYEAAGGRVTRDLFAEDETDVWLDDPDIAYQVAGERLEAHAKRLRREWAWVETSLDLPDHRMLERYGRTSPQPNEEEGARLKAIEERIEAIYDSEDGVDKEGQAELRALREESSQIHRTVEKRPLCDEARAIAGCIVAITHNGQPEVFKALVRPEDIPTPDAGAGEDETGPAIPIIGGRAKKPAKFYSDSFQESLRSLRTAAAKVKLALDPATAFDLMLFEMARQLMPDHAPCYRDGPLSVNFTPTRASYQTDKDETFAAAVADQSALLDAAGAALPSDWMRHGSSQACFRALSELDPEVKQQIFAWCVAQLPRQQLSFDADRVGAVEAAIARLDIEPHVAFRPDAAFFWNRLRKAQILDIATEVIGEAWAGKHTKDKKGDLIVFMERAFRDPGADPDIPAQAHEAIRAWAMPGFPAFDPDPLAEPASDDAGDVTATDDSHDGDGTPCGDAAAPGESIPADEGLPAFLDN